MPKPAARLRNLLPEEGQVFEVKYPFIFDPTPKGYEENGAPLDEGKWTPGIRAGDVDHYGESVEVADGIGTQIITVVSVHKPGRFAVRIFYTQKWIDPEYRTFGKNSCRVMVLEKFRRRIVGYSIPYEMSEKFRGVSEIDGTLPDFGPLLASATDA